MSLKTAALVAMAGTGLATILLLLDLITAVTGVANDIVPAAALLRTLFFFLAGLAVTVFFFVFHRAQR